MNLLFLSLNIIFNLPKKKKKKKTFVYKLNYTLRLQLSLNKLI